jgi:hypothetical protein
LKNIVVQADKTFWELGIGNRELGIGNRDCRLKDILEVQRIDGFYGFIFLGKCGSTTDFIFTLFRGAKYIQA